MAVNSKTICWQYTKITNIYKFHTGAKPKSTDVHRDVKKFHPALTKLSPPAMLVTSTALDSKLGRLLPSYCNLTCID